MKIKKTVYLLILLTITSFIVGCNFLPYGNKAPSIVSKPLTSIKIEQLYIYKVKGNDIENDTLTYSLLTHPEGMTIDTLTGAINWNPIKEQKGKHEIIINVEDKWRNATQSFTLEVNDIFLTSIDIFPSAVTLFEENLFSLTQNFLTLTTSYDYGPNKSFVLSDCVYESSNSKIATVDPEGVISGKSMGSAIITVSYTENGITKSDTIDVFVTPFIACFE